MDGIRGSGPVRRPGPTPGPPGKEKAAEEAPARAAPDRDRADSIRDRLATLGLPGGRPRGSVDLPATPVPTRVSDAEAAALGPEARELVAGIVERGRAGGGGVTRLGPPGDPCTLTAAKMVARDLGRPLLRVDLGAVADKYIGETEKNLSRVLGQAKASDAVLLFDEADALFGKRSEVEDSHGRYGNRDVSSLLSRLEEHLGIALLASNASDDDP